MSVKIKIVLGFALILVMVAVQSVLIINMNNEKDSLSKEVMSLYQLNLAVKDRMLDIKNLESDLINLITTESVIPVRVDVNALSCVYLNQSIQEWYQAFIVSAEYKSLDNARRQILIDYGPNLSDIDATLAKIRAIDPKKKDERLAIFNSEIRYSVKQLNNLTKDFVGLNSLFFSSKNQSMLAFSSRIQLNQFLLIGFALLLIIFIILYSQRLLQPLNWLMEGVHQVTRGNLEYRVRKRGNDELGRLAEQFNMMNDEIRNHREHLEELVQKRTQQLLEAKEQLEQINDNLHITNKNLEEARRIMDLDMKMAINVQGSLFMKTPPETADWEIAFYFKPMSGVSGDMYDFYIDHHTGCLLGLTLMDVSGHGIASGLVTMIAKSIAARHFHSEFNNKLNVVLEHINEELITELGNIDNYLTGIMLKFRNEMVEYVNAGHTELLMKRSDLARAAVVEPQDNTVYKGMFLGLEAMKAPFGLLSFKMKQDDMLLIYSDCLVECTNPSREEYGLDRVIQSFSEASTTSAQDALQRVIDDLFAFARTDRFEDDLTAICIRRKH